MFKEQTFRGREENGLFKNTLLEDRFPHDAFSAPLARSDLRVKGKQPNARRIVGGHSTQELDAAFLLTVGSFLLTVELLCLQLSCGAGAFLLTVGASLVTVGAFFYLQSKLFLLTVGKWL